MTMTKEYIEKTVKEIIAEQLDADPERVAPDAKLADDLGADSMDMVELVMALEEEFDIAIPAEDERRLATVGDCIKYIARLKEREG